MSKSPKFEIDYETSDKITVLNLKDTMNYMAKENKKMLQNGVMEDHEKVDFEYNARMIAHITEVLKHYGA